jgi:hypothetical protein
MKLSTRDLHPDVQNDVNRLLALAAERKAKANRENTQKGA